MTSRPLSFAALLCSMLLVFPPGWCSGLGCAVAAGHDALGAGAMEHHSATPPASCCRMPAPEAETSVPEAPAECPGVWCCCAREAVLPEVAAASVDRSVAMPAFLVDPLLPHVQPILSRIESPHGLSPGTPRLHVLKCVWRC